MPLLGVDFRNARFMAGEEARQLVGRHHEINGGTMSRTMPSTVRTSFMRFPLQRETRLLVAPGQAWSKVYRHRTGFGKSRRTAVSSAF